jgi:hypothetical protein
VHALLLRGRRDALQIEERSPIRRGFSLTVDLRDAKRSAAFVLRMLLLRSERASALPITRSGGGGDLPSVASENKHGVFD